MDINITAFIHYGKENAVTRQQLARWTGLEDRQIRKMIEAERNNGTPIMSSSHSVGYWLTEDENEKEQLCRELCGKAAKMIRTANAIRGAK